MRFLRHLGAATAAVAIVVVLGVAWAHFGAQTRAPGRRAERWWRDRECAAGEFGSARMS